MSVKIAWAKHLYNAYNSVKKGDSVYDSNGDFWEYQMGVMQDPLIRVQEVYV